MLTRRTALALLPLSLSGARKPSADRQTEILRIASAKALAYTRELPDFICTETVRRSDNVRGIGWKLKDILGIQIGISDRHEYYKLLTYNGRPTKLSYRQVGGALTEGEFGSLLAEIFRPGIAAFRWHKALQLAGRSIFVFRYRVPRKERPTISSTVIVRVSHSQQSWATVASSGWTKKPRVSFESNRRPRSPGIFPSRSQKPSSISPGFK